MTSRAGCKVRPWTGIDLRTVPHVYQDADADLDAFCAEIGRSRSALYQQASKYGWQRRADPWTDAEEAFIRRWFPTRDGKRPAEMERAIKRSWRAIKEKARRMGLRRHPEYKRRLHVEQGRINACKRHGSIWIPGDGWPPHTFRDHPEAGT